MADLPQGRALFDQQALVTSLKKMPSFSAQLVEPVGKGRLQPLHAGHQVALRCFQGHVVMVTHQHIGVQQPAGFVAGFEEAPFKRPLRSFSLKNVRPVITPVDHMVTGSRKFQSQLARHAKSSAISAAPSISISAT